VVPLEVELGFEVQAVALPDTVQTNVPVGAGRLVTPPTTAANVRVAPEYCVPLGGKIVMLGCAAPRSTAMVVDVAVR
jgi:hypothetical protein